MKRLLFSLFLLSATFLLLWVSPISAQPADSPCPLNALMRDLLAQDQITWTLTRQHDPFVDEQQLRVSSEEQMTLDVMGHVAVSTQAGSRMKSGRWIIDPQERTIQLIFAAPDAGERNLYRVERYTAELLVLSRQGRHGRVEFQYRPL